MIFGPGNRWLVYNSHGVAAKALARRMQGEFRNSRSNRQNAHRGTMASEVRIARKRARDNLEYEGRSHTMADDEDFVQTNVPTSCNDDFGKAIQPGVDVSAAAIHVVPGEDPIVQCLLYPPPSPRPVQQADE